MRHAFIALFALGLAACGSSKSSPSAPNPGTDMIPAPDVFSGNQVVLGGRWLSSASGPQSNWAGASVKTRAQGTSVTLRLTPNAAPNYKQALDVYVDGVLQPASAVMLDDSTTSYPFPLPDTTAAHTVEWRLRTEANYSTGPITFLGVDAGANTQLLNTPTPSGRQIEFIGDSITNGYGVLGNGNAPCAQDGSSEDAGLSYGALAAGYLSSDYRLIASSGRGVFRNRDSNTRSPPNAAPTTLTQIFGATLHPYISNTPTASDAEMAAAGVFPPDGDTWTPQVVVINLGTNDFSRRTDMADNSSAIPDENGFVNAYQSLIAKVYDQYPNAIVVPCLGPMLSDSMSVGTMSGSTFVPTPGAPSDTTTQPLSKARAFINEAITASQASHPDQTITNLVEFLPQDVTTAGCDAHPSKAVQDAMAQQLAGAIRANLNW